jgi:ABC-type transport system substrate-binding protein
MRQVGLLSLLAALLVGSAAASTLRYCAEGGPANFDPAVANSLSDQNAVASTVFNTLVEAEQPSGRIVPGLAAAWTVGADGREYRFRLRHGVAFQHTPWFTPSRLLSADDVVFTFQRLLRPDDSFRKAYPVESAYVLSYGLDRLIAAVEKQGDETVVFRLREPSAPFIRQLANPFASIESAEYAGRLLAKGRAPDFAQQPVGTGPFIFERMQPGSSIRFRRNPQYFKHVALADKLVFDIVPDANVRMQKLRQGECDIAASVPLADWDALATAPGIRLEAVSGANIGLLAFNTTHPPLDQPKVRQALDLAIDRAAILKTVYQGRAQLAGSLLPPSSWGRDASISPTAYDPDRARRLLAEAGVAHLKLNLWAMPVQRAYNPDARRMAALIKADWARVGVEADIVSLEWGEYLRRLGDGEHDVAMIGWSLGPDPDSLFSALQCHAGDFNYARWCNADFDGLVERGRRTTESRQRLAIYREVQALLLRERPVAAIAHGQLAVPVRQSVRGFVANPLGVMVFEGVLPNPVDTQR